MNPAAAFALGVALTLVGIWYGARQSSAFRVWLQRQITKLEDR